jgi:hypothetical protein
MTCEEFLRALDERETRSLALSAEQKQHAGSCPACALAVQLETELACAPSWAGSLRLPEKSRSRVLARAKRPALFGWPPSRLLEDSAVSSLVMAVIAGAAVYVVPGLSKRVLPPRVWDAILAALAPVLEWGHWVAEAFAPLASQGWGLPLLALALFLLVFAATLSVKAMGAGTVRS